MSSPEQKRKNSNSMWDTKLIASDLEQSSSGPPHTKDSKTLQIKERGGKQNGDGKGADANYSPSDFVIKILLDEFKTQTRKKIDEIMKFGIVSIKWLI